MQNYSVLMSVYYKEKAEYLELAIESMLKQTVPPEQFVIVEDGKLTEELEQVIIRYEKQDPNLFTIIRLDENRGLGLALNEGMRYCRNELVARMDSDDISLPQRCERQLKAFNLNPDLDIIGTQINEFIDNVNNVVSARVVPCECDSIIKFSKKRSPFNHPSVMYRKSVVLKLKGYSEKYKRKEDLDLFLKMLMDGCKAINLEEALLFYRTNIENLQRRKSWNNCYECILVMYDYLKIGYINIFDFLCVLLGQLFMFVLPNKMAEIFSRKILRKKPL